MKRRSHRKPAKKITLDPEFWLRNSQEIRQYREKKLRDQRGKCAITEVKIDVGCLDHTHKDGIGEDGCVRGVLLSEANMLEGKYLKLFKKLKLDTKYGIDFPDFLIGMGNYLKQDNSGNLLHHKFMEDYRKQVIRWRKDTLISRLREDFNITVMESLSVSDIVQIYMQAWVHSIEKELKEVK